VPDRSQDIVNWGADATNDRVYAVTALRVEPSDDPAYRNARMLP
jgi:hypothetical protein